MTDAMRDVQGRVAMALVEGLSTQRDAIDVCLSTTAKAFRRGPVRLDSRLNASQGHSRAAQAAKARAVKEMRQAFVWWAKALGPLPAQAVVLLVRCGPRPLDGDNLQAAWKAARDGLALGWGVDDGDTSRVRWVYEQAKAEYSAGVYVYDAGVAP